MTQSLLKPDGRLVSGLPCIYHLPGGLTFFSEAVREDGDSFIFDPDKTVWLAIQPPTPDGKQQVAHMKGYGPLVPFRPTTLRVGKAGVIITDCTDPAIMAIWRSALSGIVVTGPGAKMPDGERVN